MKTENVILFNNVEYEISSKSLFISNLDGVITLGLDLEASTRDESIDSELRSIRLYHNDNFVTQCKDISELKGKKFVWPNSEDKDLGSAGFLYVLEHEEVTSCTMEILDVKDDSLVIKWTGNANVYWNDEFGANVPFSCCVDVSIPKKKEITIKPLEKNRVKIDDNSYLEILNISGFNFMLGMVSLIKAWNLVNGTLKFKVNYNGVDYFGNVIFKNGKNNYKLVMKDTNCPIKINFKGFDFNFKSRYEEMRFEIE